MSERDAIRWDEVLCISIRRFSLFHITHNKQPTQDIEFLNEKKNREVNGMLHMQSSSSAKCSVYMQMNGDRKTNGVNLRRHLRLTRFSLLASTMLLFAVPRRCCCCFGCCCCGFFFSDAISRSLAFNSSSWERWMFVCCVFGSWNDMDMKRRKIGKEVRKKTAHHLKRKSRIERREIKKKVNFLRDDYFITCQAIARWWFDVSQWCVWMFSFDEIIRLWLWCVRSLIEFPVSLFRQLTLRIEHFTSFFSSHTSNQPATYRHVVSLTSLLISALAWFAIVGSSLCWSLLTLLLEEHVHLRSFLSVKFLFDSRSCAISSDIFVMSTRYFCLWCAAVLFTLPTISSSFFVSCLSFLYSPSWAALQDYWEYLWWE